MGLARAIFDGSVFVPMAPIKAKKNDVAVFMLIDGTDDHVDKPYLHFAGSLPDEDYQEITEILKDTERIDADGW